MDETETQDFMNVESFSQLPFTRRPSSKDDKNPKPIRLFGKDFTGQEDYSHPHETKNKEDEEQEQEQEDKEQVQTVKDNNTSSNNRRFECHYCFRNFPTSQALGGHQNAHKRERQLAKRGASSYFNHPDPNLYGYRHYPSWTSGPLPSARFYGGVHPPSSAYYTRPINGSPLGSHSQWRLLPSSSSSSVQGIYNNSTATFVSPHSSSNSTLPFLAGSHPQQPQPPTHVRGSLAQNLRSSYRYGLSSNVQDHVSLDLHL